MTGSSLLSAAVGVLDRNRQTGVAPWNDVAYDFTCPSHVTYPFQWFWDSCFHAIALSHIDVERARSEVAGLLANQADDGSIPHVIFWQRHEHEEAVATYAIAFRTRWLSDQMQPPALAEAVAAAAGDDDAYLAGVLPAVCRYYDWCDRVRDPDRDGLLSVLQPDETGLDHSPKFDRYLGIEGTDHDEFTAAWHRVADPYEEVGRDPRAMFDLDRFVVEDVMVNTIHVENLTVLARLCDRVGDRETADRFWERARHGTEALVGKCWDADRGLFFDLAGSAETWLDTNTITSLFPLVLEDLDPAIVDRLVAHLEDPAEYAAPYPVPSVAMDEPGFEPATVGGNLVWRGPTWMNSNWYLARGLVRHGHLGLARRVVEASVALVEMSGFREYYHPFSGEGNGAPDFGWSTLVVDMAALPLD